MQIGSCESFGTEGFYYLEPTEALCPYDGTPGQWLQESTNEGVSGYVTPVNPPSHTDHVLHYADNVAHHVLGAMLPHIPIVG